MNARIPSARCLLAQIALVALTMTGCSSVYMKGTPFYKGEYSKPQAAAADRVNLWPLAYYHEPALSVLWPLGEKTDDHIALRPLFSVHKLDQTKREYNLLWPLAQFDFLTQDHRIFPFFWGKGHDAQCPYFVAFPFFWYARDEYLALFPLLIHSYGCGPRSTHVLWPLFHSESGAGESGWRAWPLVGSYQHGSKGYRFLLWPLCNEWRDGDEVLRLALPLYYSKHEKDEGWSLLLPLYWRCYDEKRSLLISPIYARGRKGDRRWEVVFPLYFRSRKREKSKILTPLFGKFTYRNRTVWILSPLATSLTEKTSGRSVWFLAPLIHVEKKWNHWKHHVLPLYYYDGGERTFVSLPVSWKKGDGRGFLGVLGPLFFRKYSGGGNDRQTFAPFPLVSFYNQHGHEGFWVWPFFSRDKSKKGAKGYALWPLFHYRFHPKKTKVTVFPLFTAKRTVSSYKREDETTRRILRKSLWCFPTFWLKRHEESLKKPAAEVAEKKAHGSNRLWPFWHYRFRGKDLKEFCILGWLYDYKHKIHRPAEHDRLTSMATLPPSPPQAVRQRLKEKPVDYVRSRVLWRLMHYERVDHHSTLDIFPFITWDRNTDTKFRKFSFAWRFFRYERDDEGRLKLDLLFIPVCRGK